MRGWHRSLALLAWLLLLAGAPGFAVTYTVVDLHPSGFDVSDAAGASAGQQVGSGSGLGTGGDSHALLWSGTADGVVDLHPASGFQYSYGLGASGGQQVGYGIESFASGIAHALLWSGTAAGLVDLNPSDFSYSEAYGAGGGQQVGVGSGSATGYAMHALLWSGTRDSVVDLGALLPPGFGASYAKAIDVQGRIAGYAYDAQGASHAFLWVPVSEPAIPDPRL